MNTTKKITLATVKSFLKKNSGNIFIKVISEFDGMTDGTDFKKNPQFVKAGEDTLHPEHSFGINGAWFVGSSRDYFSAYEDENFIGIHVYNSCGSFDLAIEKDNKPEPEVDHFLQRGEDAGNKIEADKEQEVLFPSCDCTHTQACEICAASKDIDWSLIEGEADEKKLAAKSSVIVLVSMNVSTDTLFKKYKYIVAWGKKLLSHRYYIEEQVHKAHADGAHEDAIYKDQSSGEWHLATDLIKEKLQPYIDGTKGGYLL